MNSTQYLKTFKAIRFHFSQDYDIQKYGISGIKVSKKEYDKYNRFINKALNTFKPDEFIEYIVSNIVYGTPFDDIIKMNMTTYRKWKSVMNRLQTVVEDDIIDIRDEFLKPNNLSFSDLIKCEDGKHPYIFKMYLSNDIHKETLIILNDVFSLFNKFDECMDDYIWEDERGVLVKYSSFINYDKQNMMKRIYSVLRDEG